MAGMLKVEIWRGTEEGRYETYEVPSQPSQTVLDLVTFVQRKLDPSLAYRFACRVGVCGSCAMTVNDTPRWTCRTHVQKVVERGRVRIAPLRNLPIVKDLATDMVPFFDKGQEAKGRFIPSDAAATSVAEISPEDPKRKEADAAIECIGCAVCYAACDVVSWRPEYLGPAALNRAWTLVSDARDSDRIGHLQAVADDAGCHACHGHQNCVEHCPVGINPTRSISGLKRLVLMAAVRGRL
ncbi:MAG: succinate dehydrogenase/fumarate reductase iron-sulfur subunit [Alphaproteobacteria bacterium]|nr:succinate dehydrogenase/fumarate reductase iron-sulfur subunit [Alphaproteobacteria bacterium]